MADDQPYSFRVEVRAGEDPRVTEYDPATPPGTYQISGHDNVDATHGHSHTLSVVRHDTSGHVVVGASGYRGDGS